MTGSASCSSFGCVHSSDKEAEVGAQLSVFAGDKIASTRIALTSTVVTTTTVVVCTRAVLID